MKTLFKTSTTLFLSLLLAISLGMTLEIQAQQNENQEQKKASEVVQDWPEVAQKTAKTMIDKYGEPDGVTEDRIHWNEAGDWGLTIVQKEEIEHNFPMPHKDVLYQEIKYDTEPEIFTKIAEYDGSVIMERTKGTMAARCDKEAANYLAINLAHEVAEGEKSVEEARDFYAESIKKMVTEGESSEYLEGFIFDLPDEAADPDLAVLEIDPSEMEGETGE